MVREKAVNGGSDGSDAKPTKEAFQKACRALWESAVLADLIYGKCLQCCKSCLGMFYLGDGNSTHPPDQCIALSQVCTEKHITSEETFFNALWFEASKLSMQHGTLFVPRLAAQHEEPKKPPVDAKSQQAAWASSRIDLLEFQAQGLQREVGKLQAEKAALQEQVRQLIERLLDEKAALHRVRLCAEKHIDALHGLLHPQGCGCTGMCEEKATEQPK